MAREYLCAYHSLLETMKSLSDEEFGRLMRAAIAYSARKEPPSLDGRTALAWDMIKWQVDRDLAQYDAFCAKQSEKVRKRWKSDDTEDAVVCHGIPVHTENTTVYHGISGIPDDTEDTKTKAKTKTKTNIPPNPPEGIDEEHHSPIEQAISEFKAFRKSIKKPMTERAVELLRQRLLKLSGGDTETQIAIIDQSILQGWQGVYELKDDYADKRKIGSITDFGLRDVRDEL